MTSRRCSGCGKLHTSAQFKTCEKCRKRANDDDRLRYMREYVRDWSKVHSEQRRINEHNRRARISGNGGTFTFKELNALFEQQEGFCFYCGELLYSSFDKDIHIEHKIPISRGGVNDASNIVLSCASCNMKKHTMTHEEFMTVTRGNNCD